jgi:hypothetical protein
MGFAKKVATKTNTDLTTDVGSSNLVDWYPGAPPMLVREEVLSLGEYGLLTILHPANLPTNDRLESERQTAANTKGDWRDAMRTYRWDDYSPDL